MFLFKEYLKLHPKSACLYIFKHKEIAPIAN